MFSTLWWLFRWLNERSIKFKYHVTCRPSKFEKSNILDQNCEPYRGLTVWLSRSFAWPMERFVCDPWGYLRGMRRRVRALRFVDMRRRCVGALKHSDRRSRVRALRRVSRRGGVTEPWDVLTGGGGVFEQHSWYSALRRNASSSVSGFPGPEKPDITIIMIKSKWLAYIESNQLIFMVITGSPITFATLAFRNYTNTNCHRKLSIQSSILQKISIRLWKWQVSKSHVCPNRP